MRKLISLILSLTFLLALVGCQDEIIPPAPAPINDGTTVDASVNEGQDNELPLDVDAVDVPSEDVMADVAKTNLTMRTLRTLVARYGEDLTWTHFDEYNSKDVGSGVIILCYPIDTEYCLLIGGGSMEESPMYIKLSLVNDFDNYIDVRIDSIDDFIANE